MYYNHSRPQALHFLDCARGLWGTLRKRSQNLAMPVAQRMLSAKTKWRLMIKRFAGIMKFTFVYMLSSIHGNI